MTKHELKQLVVSKLSAKLNVLGYAVTTTSTVKANDQIVEAVVILSNEKVSQIVDLGWIYQEYAGGIAIDWIVDRIENQVLAGVPFEIERIAEMVDNFELTKDRIFASLVNTKLSSAWLRDKPHYDIDDLSVVYHVVVQHIDSDGVARIPITDSIFEIWNIEAETLHNAAMNNTYNRDPAILSPIEQKLQELTNESIDFGDNDIANKLIVVSNKLCLNGAIHMFNINALHEAAQFLETCKLYIIPSSVHEILVCAANPMCAQSLNALVKEVNRTMDPKDVLSNHIYLYDDNTNQISSK